MVGSEMS